MAPTHSSLTFDELCEEAFGSGLHPWEFYDYDLSEYLLRRKGLNNNRKAQYQELLISAMVPYMKKEERIKIVREVFRNEGAKVVSLKDQYKKLKERYEKAGVLKVKDGSE